MKKLTWLDLYNFLHKEANNINQKHPNFWQQNVLVHNIETGDEFLADPWFLTDQNNQEKLVIGINTEEMYEKN